MQASHRLVTEMGIPALSEEDVDTEVRHDQVKRPRSMGSTFVVVTHRFVIGINVQSLEMVGCLQLVLIKHKFEIILLS